MEIGVRNAARASHPASPVASAMSIASGMGMSVGSMSLESGASSQWFANSMAGSAMDDARSAAMLSDMSSDLSALDLAG